MRKNKQYRNKNFSYDFLKGPWNNLGKAKRYVVNNPLISLTIFLALVSAIWKLATNTNNNNEITKTVLPLGDDDSTKNTISCPTVIFYEAHSDKAPANMITELLPRFVNKGYRTFIFEEPTGMSLTDNIKVLKDGILLFSQHIKSNLYDDNSIFQMQALATSFNATLNLLKRIQEANLNYVAMDLDEKTRKKVNEKYGKLSAESDEIREAHKTGQIRSACEKYGSGQVVLDGVMHNSIEHKLLNAGYTNISSVYIIDHPVIHDPSLPPERRNNDLMLRTKNLMYLQKYRYEKVNIINVYDNPNINATDEVLKGFKKRNPIT